MGTNTDDGRGNVTAYFGYRNNDAILQRDRDYSACAYGAGTISAANPFGFACSGSGTTPNGTFVSNFGTFTLDETGAGDTFRPTDAFTNALSARRLQLRTDQLLSASGRALFARRLWSLRSQREPRVLHPADDDQLPVERADRVLWHLLRAELDQLRQPVALGAAAGPHLYGAHKSLRLAQTTPTRLATRCSTTASVSSKERRETASSIRRCIAVSSASGAKSWKAGITMRTSST